MKLKNVLIVVNDVEKSKAFYKDLFGLETVVEQKENAVLTEGLVLQEAEIWKSALGSEIIPRNNASELYFEEADLERFAERLEGYGDEIRYVNRLTELPWGQKMIRFYDPDGNLIEVRTPLIPSAETGGAGSEIARSYGIVYANHDSIEKLEIRSSAVCR